MKFDMGRRQAVVILLCVSVLAPIVLYTDRLSIVTNNSISRNEYSNDENENHNFSLGKDLEKLNALPQEVTNTVKEPVGEVYVDKSQNSEENLNELSDGLANSTTEELEYAKSGEHKSRVLSAAVDVGNSQEKEGVIQQVTHAAAEKNVFERTEKVDEKNDTKSQKTVFNSNKKEEEGKPKVETKQTSVKHDKQKHPIIGPDKTSRSTVISDDRLRQFRDQLIRAKAYSNLGPAKANPHFIRELRLRIKEVQRALDDATKDSDLPKNTEDKIKAMEQTLSKIQHVQDDCSSVIKKFRAMLRSVEEQLRVHKKQTIFLTQLAAKTIPKGLHCLPLRLTTEYFSLIPSQQQFPNQEKIEDPKLYHYALFSDNVLATAVVVNSTVSNAKHPADHVFHIVTDRLNYAATRMWFLANPPGKAAIQVQNIEEFTWLNESYSPVLRQLGSQSMIDYYFRNHRASSDANFKYRNPKYLSILNHLRFYLPEILPKLNKVVFLDDDIVVQKDLTGLWKIDMKGKVNGAVETCGESFHRFDKYLNFSNPLIAKNFHPRACGWAYGMNIFDLAEWRKQNVTEVYHYWQSKNNDRHLWKLGSLPPGLITFYNRTFPIDRSWHVLGLGYNPHVSQKEIERGAVVHYNGNMKPWLEIGLPKYRGYWSKYVDYDQLFLRECNINP